MQITVQGSSGVHQSLLSSFVYKEQLNGNNKYRCEKCNNQYQDAEKYCQLKTLPPILTLSLLRFTYDLKTYQRIKATGRFEFPLELDLSEFMEDSIKATTPKEYTAYELYSVIIHSGSAYGGHYHAFIRDLDNLGNWTLAEDYKRLKEQQNLSEKDASNDGSDTQDAKPDFQIEENNLIQEICLIVNEETEYQDSQKDNELVNLDYIKYEKPLDLLKAYTYNKYKYGEVRIDSICADLTKTTGTSWNKRFKSKYGTIEKFLRKNELTFNVSADSRFVSLKPHDRINIVSSRLYNNEEKNDLIGSCLKEVDDKFKAENKSQESKLGKLSEEDELELNHTTQSRWYNFDDSRITPIFSSAIRKQFEGKESAYMLFYRRKSAAKSQNRNFIHPWLLEEITNQNAALNKTREEYETSLNSHRIQCYLDTDFYLEKCVLNLNHQSENKQFTLLFDKRNTKVSDLRELLVKLCTEPASDGDMQSRQESCLNMLLDDTRQFYWLLAKRVTTSGNNDRFNFYIKSIVDTNSANDSLFSLIAAEKDLFLILSKQCDKWPVGEDYEPVRVVFKFFDKNLQIREVSYTFVKSALIKDMKREMSTFLVNEQTDYELGLTNEEIEKMALDYNYMFSLIRSDRKK